MINDTSLVQPLLQLLSGQCMHLNVYTRNYEFPPISSTVKAVTVAFKESAEGAVPDRGGDAFTGEVQRQIWGWKRTLKDDRKQHARLDKKYDKLSNEFKQILGFLPQLEEVTKRPKPAAVGEHFVTYGVHQSKTQCFLYFLCVACYIAALV